jgi:hypothetical protein
MIRTILLLAVALMIPGLAVSVALACEMDAAGTCPQHTMLVVRVSPSEAPHLLVEGITGMVHGLKAGIHATPRVLGTVGRTAAAKTGLAGGAVRGTASRVDNAFQQTIGEVRALSLHLLRSAFSIIWVLLSGLLRS